MLALLCAWFLRLARSTLVHEKVLAICDKPLKILSV